MTTNQMPAFYADYSPPPPRSEWDKTLARREFILKRIALYKDGGANYLDIGCGWGAHLLAAMEAGFNIHGADIGAHVSNVEKIGGKWFQGEIYNAPESFAKPGSMDVIVMNHSLEHVTRLNTVLEKVKSLLADGGLFCGAVPNFTSLCSQVMTDKWPWLDANLHVSYFTIPTLAQVLKAKGFKLLEIFTHNEGGYHIPDIVDEAEKLGIPYGYLDRNGLCEEIFFFAGHK